MHSISAFFISQLPNNAAVASRSVLLLDQSQKNHGKNIYEQSILLHKDHDAVSVAEGGSPTTYVNARLCGRMVVVTTYKMQRFMQIMTFCLFAPQNSEQGGAGGNCQRFQIRSSETSPVKLRETSIVNVEEAE